MFRGTAKDRPPPGFGIVCAARDRPVGAVVMRGALVGCGYISKQQLQSWSEIEQVEITAVCDLDEGKARRRADAFGIPAVYTSYTRMLEAEDLDFVDIATRPDSHLELAAAAAGKDLPVLCQKPLADTLAESRAIVKLFDDAGLLLMVNENCRHQAWFRKMKALIEDGRLGEVHDARFEARWRSTLPEPDFEGQDYFREMPLLFIFEMGVHYLDTARYLFGEARSVYADVQQVSPFIAGEDSALLLSRHGSVRCLIDGNWYSFSEPGETVSWGEVRIEGTHGTLHLKRDGALFLYDEAGVRRWDFEADTVGRSFTAAQAHFIDCLTDGREPETSGRETLRTMELVFSGYQSAREQRRIELPDRTRGSR